MNDSPVPPEQPLDQQPEASAPVEGDAMAALALERDTWKDKAYRLAADAENAKRRAKDEVESARKYALQGFAKDLLPVADNLLRALASDGDAKAIRDGVAMVAGALEQVFGRNGIVKIEVIPGQPLNPELHQAMTQVASAHPAGHIVAELQSGFTLNGRLLRPAMVSVSGGAGS
jgi:molecular chaperone GrpE